MIAAAERSGRTLVVCCASSVWDTGGEQVCSSRNSSNAPCQRFGSLDTARQGRSDFERNTGSDRKSIKDRQIRRKLYFLWK